MTNVVCGWLEALDQEDGVQGSRRPGVFPHDEAHFLRVRAQLLKLEKPTTANVLTMHRGVHGKRQEVFGKNYWSVC